MKVCRLCDKVVLAFAKSHIFPLSLARDMGNGGPLVKLGPTRLSRAPKGLHARIVCHGCEKASREADDELIRFVRDLNQRPTSSDATARVIDIPVKNELLQRAFVQIFFRAAVCDLEAYTDVLVDEFRLRKIRDTLLGNFSVFRSGIEIAVCHRSDAIGRHIFFAVDVVKVGIYTYYEFGLPGFCISISDGFLPPGLRELRLRRHGHLILLSAPMDASEMSGVTDAVNEVGGLSVIKDFFDSPRGRFGPVS